MISRVITLMFYQTALGSSPRVWGQVNSTTIFLQCTGIIPTRMGTRSLYICNTARPQDHPHAYGDKYSVIVCMVFAEGSSPRVWGQGLQALSITSAGGIIPTRMGTSRAMRVVTYRVRDHPHAYGDKFS